jgi:predicted ATP-dependent Lon-type protease
MRCSTNILQAALFAKLHTSFYAGPVDAVFKAMGVR